MKRIGLLGGMSWESSIEYERLINEGVRSRLGGVTSADLIIRSYDFAEIERLQANDAWEEAGALLAEDARALEAFGAEVVALCTNTMHVVAPTIEAAITVPFIHIADATARRIHDAGISTVGLLGTRYTMEQPFYRSRLEEQGIATIVPAADDRAVVHDIIYRELVQGIILSASRSAVLEIVDRLAREGAHGVIAGCTEIELLVTEHDLTVPYFPTTAIHAEAIVAAALS